MVRVCLLSAFDVSSEMPWNGKVVVTCTAEEAAEMKLAVRIPGWCGKWTVQGTEGFTCTEEKGYYYIDEIWFRGREIRFDFAMEPCFYQADYRVREDIGKLALRKGPVVYCAYRTPGMLCTQNTKNRNTGLPC